MMQAIINAHLFIDDTIVTGKNLLIENGIITDIVSEIPSHAKLIDAGGSNLAAGFIDIQLNGGEDLYFSEHIHADTLHDMQQACFKNGTTHFLPCLISSPQQNILKAIHLVKDYKTKNKAVLGLHVEGPFINSEKRGAHNAAYVRKPTHNEIDELITHGAGLIKIMTIAPELFTIEQINRLQQNGIILSMGHTNLSYEQAQYYFNNGIHLVTHLFNAMTQFGHRTPGMVGAVLDNEKVFAPIILDGAHCHYAAARIAYAIKKQKLFLITDASFLGRKKEHFQSNFLNARLIDGFYKNDEGNLAGAAISMVDAVIQAKANLPISLPEAVQMANARVAAAIGLSNQYGKIAKGYPASFVKFTNDFTQVDTLIG